MTRKYFAFCAKSYSKIDKNYNPKQNTGKSKDIIRYAQKNIMKTCIFKYEIVLTQNEKYANI